MLEVISHGNEIRCGSYTLHSKFRSAVNFQSNDAFAFVVTVGVGAGPLNIVLREHDIDFLQNLQIENDCFYLDGVRYCRSNTRCYNSRIEVSAYDNTLFLSNLLVLEQSLLNLSHPKSLAFLLDEKRTSAFTSSFEIEYAKRCESGFRRIFSGDLAGGIAVMRGLGPGLTPSGDDFISGLLIALNMLQVLQLGDYLQEIDLIRRTAEGNNPFTNAFLQCAAKGQVGEKFKWLIESLLQCGEYEITRNLKLVLNMGETSGADQATGFCAGLEWKLAHQAFSGLSNSLLASSQVPFPLLRGRGLRGGRQSNFTESTTSSNEIFVMTSPHRPPTFGKELFRPLLPSKQRTGQVPERER
jgi:hypothetical protein